MSWTRFVFLIVCLPFTSDFEDLKLQGYCFLLLLISLFYLLQNLDRIKCRLLEGTNAQDVRALVLDMQARLLLDMLGKGIESALINPSTLLPEPWQASSDVLSSIGPDKMTVDPALLLSIQVYCVSCSFDFLVHSFSSIC